MSAGASSPRRYFPGLAVELGAQWIGDTHHRMFALAAELGVETYRQYDQGETSYDLAGSGVLRERDFHTQFADELADLQRVLRRLDELAAEVPPETPWLAPHAAEWDVMSCRRRGHARQEISMRRTPATREVHADLAVDGSSHVVDVRLQPVQAWCCQRRERPRRQPRLEQLHHLDVQVLPPASSTNSTGPSTDARSPARHRAAR